MRQETSDTQEVGPAVRRSDGPDHSVTAATSKTERERRQGKKNNMECGTMRRGTHQTHIETVCGLWKRRRSWRSATKRP